MEKLDTGAILLISLMLCASVTAITCTKMTYTHDEKMAELGYERVPVAGVQGTAWRKASGGAENGEQ